MNLLIKLFIKDKDNIASPGVRAAYATVFGCLGIVLNLFLFVIKFVVGNVFRSISIVADAFNNLSDAGSSVINIIGFRIAGKAADADHPYGHGRSEYISGLVVSMIILYVGIELARSSVDKLIHPEKAIFDLPVAITLVISIMVKLYMYHYNKKLGDKLGSPAFTAVATDSISDVWVTTAVLAAALLERFTGANIDGIAGLFVAVIIFKGGVESFRDTTDALMGAGPGTELSDEIKSITSQYSEILGIHDIMVHDYGPGRHIITFHAEVPSNGNMMELHDIIDNLERRINHAVSAQTVIHMDPVAMDDPEVSMIREQVLKISKELCPESSIHDFRIVKGPTHTNLIFDAVLPYSSDVEPDFYLMGLRKNIKKLDEKYFTAITLDRE